MASCVVVIYILPLNNISTCYSLILVDAHLFSEFNFLFYQKISHSCFLATDWSEQIYMEIKYLQKGTAKGSW